MNRTVTNVVLIQNAVETLGYFSMQIAQALRRRGVNVYWIDYDRMEESLDGLGRFAGYRDTELLTFNFIGLSGEDVFVWDGETGETLWEHYGMRYVNILVDHPMYFHAKLLRAPQGMRLFCIDREHVRYVRRFYPGIATEFLPIAGNELLRDEGDAIAGNELLWNEEATAGDELPRDARKTTAVNELLWNEEAIAGKEQPAGREQGQPGKARLSDNGEAVLRQDCQVCVPPYEKRRFDLVFTANYVPSAGLLAWLGAQGPEYEVFYRGIFEDLIAHPLQSVDAVMERHIREELGALPDTDLRSAQAGMAVIDLCARAYYREKILAALTDAGIRVHVFGADWERMPCRKPQNLICSGGQVSPADCVRAVGEARLALNILPWFKDGAHDRIFTAMLQRTAVISDPSRYLEEQFTDGEDIAFFSPEHIGKLPEQIDRLLADEARLLRIAERGYQKAVRLHTWERRVELFQEDDLFSV